MMRDFIGAIKEGVTNEQLNEVAGTKGKDYIGAAKAGMTNEQFATSLNSEKAKSTEEESNRRLDGDKPETKFLKLEGEDYTQGDFVDRVKDELSSAVDAGGEALSKIGEAGFAPVAFISSITPAKEWTSLMKESISEGVKIWGDRVAKNKEDRIRKYGSESWGVGEGIGEVVPEIAVTSGKTLKATGTFATEFALSSVRNELFKDTNVSMWDKMKTISSDALTATIGLKIIERYLPSNQMDELSELTSSIADKTEKEILENAVSAMKRAGVDDLDFKARDRLLEKIVSGEIKGNRELSSAIKSSLETAKKAALAKTDELYKTARPIAEASRKIRGDKLQDDFLGWLDETGADELPHSYIFETEGQIDILKKFQEELPLSTRNAHDLELLRRKHSKLSSSLTDERKIAHGKIADYLEGKTDELLEESGNAGIYSPARESYKDYLASFTKRGSGEGAKLGETIEPILKKPEATGVDKQFFGAKINQNRAIDYVKKVKGSKKEMNAVVESYLIENVDKLNTEKGVFELISNYDKLDKKSIEILIGKKGAKELEGNINALDIVHQAIKVAQIKDKSITKDLLNFGAAAAAFKISPYASVHVAINSAKGILDKTMSLKRQKSDLMRKISRMEITPVTRKLLKAINMIAVPTTSEAARQTASEAYTSASSSNKEKKD